VIVNTRRLFARLLSTMDIGAICDVGSMNGAEALAFSEAAPQSRVYAFEPNPSNLRLMQANRGLQRPNIQIVASAATDYDGEADFFLVAPDYSQGGSRRGMRSFYRRSGEWASASVVRVKTTRLDTFLADKCPGVARLALWIDTEGTAYELIEGASGVAEQVHLLHVEVETSPCIGTGQRLYSEVKSLLRRLGFAEVATDEPPSHVQFNALFVRIDLPAGMRLPVRVWLVWTWPGYLAVRLASRLRFACLRRYEAMRRKAGP
jgi:FkbM family methyltransferase